jgi:hypothetical protein
VAPVAPVAPRGPRLTQTASRGQHHSDQRQPSHLSATQPLARGDRASPASVQPCAHLSEPSLSISSTSQSTAPIRPASPDPALCAATYADGTRSATWRVREPALQRMRPIEGGSGDVGERVRVERSATLTEVYHTDKLTATHFRNYGSGHMELRLYHCIDALGRKPRAVRNASVVRRLPEVFQQARRQLCSASPTGYRVVSPVDCGFVKQKANVICVCPSGTGKTHIATALGMAAIEAGYRVRFIGAV